MVEAGYMIEYCGAVYVHELLVAVLVLVAIWIPSVAKGLYHLCNNLVRLLYKLCRRWF